MVRAVDDQVRRCYDKKLINGKEKWSCKACSTPYTLNVSRMRKHILESCPKTSEIIKSQLAGVRVEQLENDADDPSASRSPTPSSTSSGEGRALATPRRTLERFVDVVGPHEKNQLDEMMARAIYHSGIALETFNTRYWKDFFQKLRPSYDPPSRYCLSNRLLDNEFENIQAENNQKIQNAKALGIMTDSYTNVRGESVIKIIVTTPEPVTYKYVFRGQNRETGNYVGNELCVVIRQIGPDKFWLLVTDNASNMKVAWTVVTDEFPHIQAAGCAAHCWQLEFKDIVIKIKIINRTYNQARSIAKYVKRHSNVLAVFTAKQQDKYGSKSISLKLPPKTRWGGAVIVMDSVLKNKVALQETVISEDLEQVDNRVRDTVLSNAFWERLKIVHDTLVPIHAAITLIEGNNALLSDVYYLQKRFSECVVSHLDALRLKPAAKNQVKTILEERKDYTITAIHLAAFMIDPRFCGEGLEYEEDIIATTFIAQVAVREGMSEGEAIANLGEFRSKRGFFAMPAIWEAAQRMSPAVWWTGLCSSQPLSKLAANLLSLPPTAAEVERGWSNYGHVHDKKRNRLLNTRASKLVSVRTGLCAAARKNKECKPLPLRVLDQYLNEGALNARRGDEATVDGDGLDEESEEEDELSEEEWTWEGGDGDEDSEEDQENGEEEVRQGELERPNHRNADASGGGDMPPPPPPPPTPTRVTRAAAASQAATAGKAPPAKRRRH